MNSPVRSRGPTSSATKKERTLNAAALRGGVFARNNLLNLMPALVTLKHADFQIFERMWRPSNQMRVAAALFTAKR
jgi:hypothetical protein